MALLRRVIGDALRARRLAQRRTLREVSAAANVSLGYLSEIERGQKEASSELLSAICEALRAQLSEVIREASDTLALAEQMEQVLLPVGSAMTADHVATELSGQASVNSGNPAAVVAAADRSVTVIDGDLSVAVHRTGPLTTTLRASRTGGARCSGRDVVRAA